MTPKQINEVVESLECKFRYLVIGVLIMLVTMAAGFAWAGMWTRSEFRETQGVLVKNQCDVLNRLAETKVFIRGFLEESEPDTPGDAVRFRVADEQLTEGIRALMADIERTPNCEPFPILVAQGLNGPVAPSRSSP